MKNFVVVTLLNRGFLARGEALFRSLHRFHPDTPGMALLVDRWPQDRPRPSEFGTVTLDEAGLAEPRRLFRLTSYERVLTFRSLAMQIAFERYPQAKSVLFLDADMLVLSPLTPILESLAGHAVLLTPHLLEPDSNLPLQEHQLNRVGVFNAGVIGVTREHGSPVLDWYEARLERDCLFDHSRGLHLDQKWLDLIPSLFEHTVIYRHAGANVAYWNLCERQLERGPEGYRVGESPLLLFHFSGWSERAPTRLSHYLGGGFSPPEDSALSELLKDYSQQVMESSYADLLGEPSAYDFYHSGEKISDLDSMIYEALIEEQLPDDYDPYGGLPIDWRVRTLRLFEYLMRGVPWSHDSMRHLPGFKTLVKLMRRRDR